MFRRLVTAVSKALSKAPSPAEVKNNDGEQKPTQQNNDYDLQNLNLPSSTAETKSESKKGDAKSTAVIRSTDSLGEARPMTRMFLSSGEQQPKAFFPKGVEDIIDGYHDGDFDARGYTHEQYQQFSLFGNQIPLIAYKLGTLCLASQRTAAFALAQQHPSSLNCPVTVIAPNSVVAEGPALGLAAAGGDHFLVQRLKTLLPKSVANAQLVARFPDGWIDEQKAINKGLLDALIDFRDRLAKNRLPEDCLFADALKQRWNLIIEFRKLLRSRLQGPAGTPRKVGLILDPQVCVEARALILASEKDLGGWTSPESGLLWVAGFQSFLGNGSAILLQILREGADNYSGEKAPAEALELKNGSPAFSNDPATGLGATVVVDLFDGDIYGCSGVVARAEVFRGRVAAFWRTYVEQQHQYCRAYAASGPAVNNDAGAVAFRRNP